MKTNSIKAALAVTLLAATAFAPGIAAAPHTEAGAFTITLPEGYTAFVAQKQKTTSPEGDIETTNWVSKAPTGEAIVVTMSQMPARILSPEKMIDGTRDSLLKSLGAKLENESKSEDLTRAQLLFKSDAAVFQSRLLVDEDRLFQLLYVGRSDEQRTAPQVHALFDSFQVDSAPAASPTAAAGEAPVADGQ